MRIAVDGMGGDYAPRVVVEGAVLASIAYKYQIVLVGIAHVLQQELAHCKNASAADIVIQDAKEVVAMDEAPTVTIRKKKDSSISVGVTLAKNKEVDAFVSAGNTGGVVCAAAMHWGLLPGVERPGISIVFPTPKDNAMMIDVGANIDPKPMHLLQYAVMGDAYARHILLKPNPTVGLLSVGEEATKGTDFVKETYKLLSATKLNFIGNIEGRDIFTGACDIIITDGFVGNVVLKVAEGLGSAISTLLKRELKKGLLSRIGALLSVSAFHGLRQKMDYAEYGGAPLLGVDGRCIISHGSSNAKAIKNAIRVAGETVDHRLNRHIVEALQAL